MKFSDNKAYLQMEEELKKARIPVPSLDDPIKPDPDALLTMVAWGDPQISSLSSLRSANLTSACRDIANAEGSFDALLMLGDIAEFGRQCEYDMCRNIIAPVEDKLGSIICVTGNHDVRLRNHKKQLVKFRTFTNSFKNGVSSGMDRYWYTAEIKGYKFIMMGTDATTLEGAYLSSAQLDFIDRELASAPAGKPVFVLNHQTLANTNGLPEVWQANGKWRGSVGWQSEKLGNILSKYNNVIFITGHLHMGVNMSNYEDCGGFKALSLPTVGVENHGEFSNRAQGYVISVYEDKIILRARIFSEGKWVPEERINAKVEIKLI